MKYIWIFFVLSFMAIGMVACSDDSGEPSPDNFDRAAMLANWADNIIIPGYVQYTEDLKDLQQATSGFANAPSETTLNELRNAWLEAYKAWQSVSMFEIGLAESSSLRNYTNIYPTNTAQIDDHIQTGDYNLELPSNFAAQGFPALDYLLYGTGSNEAEIVVTLSQISHQQYLQDLANRLELLASAVLSDWQSGYRDAFVDNDGSSATASVDKMVNDALFYFEKFLRAGKVGIPAGVFSGSSISTSVEAPYSAIYSKTLLLLGLDAFQNFYNGVYNNGQASGESLHTYLAYIQSIQGGNDLVEPINNQLNMVRSSTGNLNDNLKLQVEQDNILMLATYDEMQKAIPLLKVDMLQALDIKVDFVDADGD